MASVRIELGDLRRQIADALYDGVREGLERIEDDFGPVIAAALRAQVRVKTTRSSASATGAVAEGEAEPEEGQEDEEAEDGEEQGAEESSGSEASRRPYKRSLSELRATGERICAYVEKHPWSHAAQIAKALGVAPIDLEIPLRLLQSKDTRGRPTTKPPKLAHVGQRKGTRYALVGTPPPKPRPRSRR